MKQIFLKTMQEQAEEYRASLIEAVAEMMKI